MNKVLIIIPAFNEEESLESFIRDLCSEEVRKFADVLVINDASMDQTAFIAWSNKVATITHIFNLGYGSALQVGYKYATRNHYDYVIQLDADGQHSVSNIENIYKELKTPDEEGKKPDIVIGSRFLQGSKVYKISLLRRISMAWFSWIIKKTTGRVITDSTSGLQGLNREAFTYYSKFGNFDYLYPDANMIIQMLLLGYSIKEIPAVMYERNFGESMHSGLLKQLIYMLIMPLSILTVITRVKKGLQK